MGNLRKALETIALNNAQGLVSDAILEKACEAYKERSEDFVDSYEYNLFVTKSLYDHINGVPQDSEIAKAIMPGQTKVVNGVVYIWTLTPNAKTTYDWRVYNPTGKNKTNDNSSKTKASKSSAKAVNDMFPKDPSELVFVKNLGGSTGAKLMKDAKGREFVVKSSKNTNNAHVLSEYYASQIYSLCGLDTPDYELYDDGKDVTLISHYMRGVKAPTLNDYAELAKGFVVDTFLANWDVYQNDNCLVDGAGKIYRVDNGGSLNFRAQGATKPFGSKIDWDNMVRYNQAIFSQLKIEDVIKQIDDLKARKDQILSYAETGALQKVQPQLKGILEARFDDLERIRGQYEVLLQRQNRKVKPRKIKPASEMYRDFSDDEINSLWANATGNTPGNKLTHIGNNGWDLLSTICKMRGFDVRPDVVDDATFWKKVASSKRHLFRGVSARGRDKTYYSDDFKFNDNCFYGNTGIYGEGIYFHVNDSHDADKTPTGYKSSGAYSHARSYAGSTGDIIEAVIDDSAKIIKVDDVLKEVESMSNSNNKALKKALDEQKKAEDEYNTAKSELNNLSQNTEKKVRTDMHYDDFSYSDIPMQIDQVIDWGAIDVDGKPNYISFDDFVGNHLSNWVKRNGGSITLKGDKGTETYVIKMPNSTEQFMFSRFRYENNAIKRKNAFARPYHYMVKQFKDYIMREHYGRIEDAVRKAVDNLGDETQRLKKVMKDKLDAYNTKTDEVKRIKTAGVGDPNKDIYAAIYNNRYDTEVLGVYAALKGYDAMIQPNGNYSGNSFLIVFNRSKITARK